MSNDKGKQAEPRKIWKIAGEILETWKKPNYGAVPYLEAMRQLNDVSDNFYLDSGQEVVARFLGNANTWRGEDARRIKAELRIALDNVDDEQAAANMNAAYRQ